MKAEHYGIKLAAEIKAKGYSKAKIAESLNISYNTLMARIRIGNFSHAEVLLLIDNRYITV